LFLFLAVMIWLISMQNFLWFTVNQ